MHEKVAAEFLAAFSQRIQGKVALVAEPKALAILNGADDLRAAQEGDFDTEWLSYTLGVKVVADVDEAIDHMRIHNASHSDAIMTNSLASAETFINSVGFGGSLCECIDTLYRWCAIWFRSGSCCVDTEAPCSWSYGLRRIDQL